MCNKKHASNKIENLYIPYMYIFYMISLKTKVYCINSYIGKLIQDTKKLQLLYIVDHGFHFIYFLSIIMLLGK